MRRHFVLLVVLTVSCGWAGDKLHAQVIRTGPIGGGGINVGPIGGGLSGGFNNPLGGTGTLTAPNLGGPGSLGSSLPGVQTYDVNAGAPAAQSVGVGSLNAASSSYDDEHRSVDRAAISYSSQDDDEQSVPYATVHAAGGGPPPEEGDDGDGDDGGDDDDDDDDDDTINWWLWGPLAFVGLIVAVRFMR